MSLKTRRKHLPAFKAKVAMAALAGDKTRSSPEPDYRVSIVRYRPAGATCQDSVAQARTSIMQYVEWHNRARLHFSLERKTPYQANTGLLSLVKMKA